MSIENKFSNKIYLSIGSNINNRIEFIKQAIHMLTYSNIIFDTKISSYYETEPIGYKNQNNFLNIAVEAYTQHNPFELMNLIKSTEYLIGRKIRQRWTQREIDIDIIFYNDLILDTPKLNIPHILMHDRNFVLIPIAELNSNLIHPNFNKNIKQLIEENDDKSYIKKLKTK